MAAHGRNEGFHVLDEFVCQAVHAPSIPLASPTNQGQNEGMSVIEEIVFDVGGEKTADELGDPDIRRMAPLSESDAELRSVSEQLAAIILASRNPRWLMTHFMESVLAEIKSIDEEAAERLGR